MKKRAIICFLCTTGTSIYSADHTELETAISTTVTVSSATPDRRLHELLTAIVRQDKNKVRLLASPDIINEARPIWIGMIDTHEDTPLGLATRLEMHAKDDVNNHFWTPKGKEVIQDIITILKSKGATNSASRKMSLDEIKEYTKTNTLVFFTDEENDAWYGRKQSAK